MRLTKKFVIILIFILFVFGPVVKGQVGLDPLAGSGKSLLSPITLNWWVVWENPSDFTGLINNFRANYPHIRINVTKLRYTEYKDALIRAWARNEGPDIFSLPNTWIREYEEWIEPMPERVVLKRETETGPGCFRKRTVVERTETLMRATDIRNKFVPQIEKDVISKGRVFALPLNFDSLVLFYNRDLLDTAKIPLPPKNWTEFSDQVRQLTILDRDGAIHQAGAALGTANNIERPSDILSLLMMQSGATMTAPNGSVIFNQALPGDQTYFPAEDALRFYTDFQDFDKEVYTWNEEMPSALEMFIQGKLGFFFGYAYHLPLIKTQAPNLKLGLAEMPQLEGAIREVNFAHYPVQVVARKSNHKDIAWAFLNQASSNPQNYLTKIKRPTALRSLIPEQIQDPELEVFVKQVLTAQSWYLGKNALMMEAAFKEMIENVINDERTYREALNFTVQKINQTIK